MRAVSWLHFYLAALRAPRNLRPHDRVRNAAFVLNGRVFAGIQWRAPR